MGYAFRLIGVALVISACGAQSAAIDGSVVRVAGTACLNPIIATGVIVEDGLVLTVAHAVAGAEDDLAVVTTSGEEYIVDVIGFDPELDLALLAAPGLTGEFVSFADARAGGTGEINSVSRDQEVELVDYEVLRLVNARSGDIYDEGHVERDTLDISARLTHGMSGAPLVHGDGSIVGVVFAISNDREDAGYALASNEIEAFLDGVDRSSVSERGSCR